MVPTPAAVHVSLQKEPRPSRRVDDARHRCIAGFCAGAHLLGHGLDTWRVLRRRKPTIRQDCTAVITPRESLYPDRGTPVAAAADDVRIFPPPTKCVSLSPRVPALQDGDTLLDPVTRAAVDGTR